MLAGRGSKRTGGWEDPEDREEAALKADKASRIKH
jgi:hypothetical protein